jgi:hypothetical protein
LGTGSFVEFAVVGDEENTGRFVLFVVDDDDGTGSVLFVEFVLFGVEGVVVVEFVVAGDDEGPDVSLWGWSMSSGECRVCR